MTATDTEGLALVEGDGIAAVCAARLLSDAGSRCVWQPNARPKLAAILLGEQTQRFLREVFPADEHHPQDLLAGFHVIRRRVVLWGDAPEALSLPHVGVVAPEAELLRRLWERVPALQSAASDDFEETSWHLQTTRSDAAARSFGNRQACFEIVKLRDGITQDACWVESVANGWLFLLSTGEGKATLISVGDRADALLSSSHLVQDQMKDRIEVVATVPAYPRLKKLLAEKNILRCGGAAMSFDPLCGEGAGHAVREAFLAAAVVRAPSTCSLEQLSCHYSDRLSRGFLRHLQVCLQFYSSGGSGEFWQEQAETLRAGIQDLQAALGPDEKAHFRLIDRDLVPMS